MPEKPMCSAIITTYGRDFAMLRAAIDSVLAQTYSPMELTVVSDNDPKSETAQSLAEGMAREYGGVRFIQLDKNSGAQVARNTGIRASGGEFVAFLDDDDLWEPEKIAKQLPLFDDPEVCLAYCRGYIFYNDDRKEYKEYYNSRLGFKPRVTFEELLTRDSIGSTSQAVIRRSCFQDCGYFDENLKARQDYDRWLSITLRHRAAGVDEPLFWHRMHKGGQITKSARVALEANAYVFNKYKEYFKRSPEGRMAYYYNRAFVLRRMGKPLGFAGSAARSFFCAPGAFVKKFRGYREEE